MKHVMAVVGFVAATAALSAQPASGPPSGVMPFTAAANRRGVRGRRYPGDRALCPGRSDRQARPVSTAA